MALTDGVSFAGYTILSRLSAVRTGAVYLAERGPDLVALTVLDAEVSADPDFQRQFRRDLGIVAGFDHPNIAKVLGHGMAADHLWVATEFVDGPDAARLLRERYRDGMPARAVVRIVQRVAEALDYAHERKVLHRHVNPSAVLVVEPYSRSFRIMVTGFGTGAPRKNAGRRTDQYALAATTLSLLTGRSLSAYREGGLADTRPDLAALDPVIARALAKDPTQRFASCGEFAAALAAAMTSAPPAERPAKQRNRRRLVQTALSIAAVAALAVACWVVVKPPTFASDQTVASQTSVRPSPEGTVAPVVPPPGCAAPGAAVAALSTRDKLAQLLMVGVTDADDARAVVADHHVGGIFIGSWTDLSMLGSGEVREIAASAGALPLAVSVDEEGGRVQRLSGLIGSQPSPRSLAETSSPEQVYDIALKRGRKMKELGITIDFAPVVDVTGAADDTVIGDRSFGSDPETVTTYAGAYAQGLRDAGLLPVLKHFPGHGHGSGDSHTGFVGTPPLEELLDDDLVPYRTLTSVTPVAVMLGHLEVPGLTGSDPASLSKPAYDLLRSGGYGGAPFTGPVFTDDLSSMAAINQRYGVAEAVLRALQAGADVALWITTDEVPAVLDGLEQAVGSGQLTMDRVNEAVTRVAAMKAPTPAPCGG